LHFTLGMWIILEASFVVYSTFDVNSSLLSFSRDLSLSSPDQKSLDRTSFGVLTGPLMVMARWRVV